MSDYIKREDALKVIHGLTMYRGTIPFDSVIFNINKIPPADVRDDATAHKVVGGGERDGATCWFECSHCHGTVDILDAYCKHCGALLELENDL